MANEQRVSDEQLRGLESMTLPPTMTVDIIHDLLDARRERDEARRAIVWLTSENADDDTEPPWVIAIVDTARADIEAWEKRFHGQFCNWENEKLAREQAERELAEARVALVWCYEHEIVPAPDDVMLAVIRAYDAAREEKP